jgi:hypothetical protein
VQRRRAAALLCLVSCRGLLEIPDDPRVEPDAHAGRYHSEGHHWRSSDVPQPDAGGSAAPAPAISPVSAEVDVALRAGPDAGAETFSLEFAP